MKKQDNFRNLFDKKARGENAPPHQDWDAAFPAIRHLSFVIRAGLV
jgi:hypothetical protein